MTDKQFTRPIRVLISGGGTGGHIFPALSIAGEVRRRYPDAEILFVGAQGRMEMEKVPAAGYEIIGLPVSGLNRKNPLKNFKVIAQFIKSSFLAGDILKKFKPDVVVGVGGYASSPMLKAAQRKHIPTLIQEQNSYAGVTNKMLAAKADCICVAYDGMSRFFPAKKIVLTGNPVRSNLLNCAATTQQAREAFGLNPGVSTILVIGGSLGARTINESIIAALPAFKENAQKVQIIWQSGKYYDEQCAKALAESGATNVKQMPFIANMDMAYRAADLVVSRAGASSISELQLLGKASILVPSPNVAEDHQTKNALALVNRGAALLVADVEAKAKLATTMLSTVADESLLRSLEKNVASMALNNAAQEIVDHLLNLIKEK